MGLQECQPSILSVMSLAVTSYYNDKYSRDVTMQMYTCWVKLPKRTKKGYIV